MTQKNHYLNLVVNGKSLEFEKQDLNIRLNSVILDAALLSTRQADYSFSFDIPANPNNNKIFDYANLLDKPNKFNKHFEAKLYADEELIFDGVLVINSYKDGKYNVNLVLPKTYNLDDIFGDATLYDIPWYKPFSGVSSINAYNASGDAETVFPLISYGVFQKTPYNADEVANDYTSKFVLDKYNKWWVESFYPSLNMLEAVKKAFEWKGYIVGGSAFVDNDLSSIYMSINLSDEQVPVYNLKNPLFGEVNINVNFATSGDGYEQELSFPYFHVKNRKAGFGSAESVQTNTKTEDAWNFPAIRIYDLLKSGSTIVNQSYIYDPNEKLIVIPADGWYQIDLSVSTSLQYSTTSFTVSQNVITDGGRGDDIEEKDIEIPLDIKEFTPVEIQLVRNYDDNIELIKGKWNVEYANGNPTETAYTVSNRTINNVNRWRTCFPHEDPYNSDLPTKRNELSLRNTQPQFVGNIIAASSVNGVGGSRSGGGNGFATGRRYGGDTTTPRTYNGNMFGYVYGDGQIMCYDPAVSKGFICGFSSMASVPAVMKNGFSWTKSYADRTGSFYIQNGYNKLFRNGNNAAAVEESATTFNKNEYINSPVPTFQYGYRLIDGKKVYTTMQGNLSTLVYLNKNDRLELFEVHRAYNNKSGNTVNYSTITSANLKIKAMSPKSQAYLIENGFGYDSESQFDENLRLSNFLSNETTISSFIQNILDAFNLQMSQTGKNITIDKKLQLNKYLPATINLDEKAYSKNAETSKIEYPSKMSVKYKIDTDEWGFEKSVPEEYINDDDWKDYGDYGYTELTIDSDPYNTTKEEKTIDFSYNWNDEFKWIEVDSADTENSGNTINLNIPVISKFQWMVDGYDYDESMKHDGYGLIQRLWFKPSKTNAFVWTDSYPAEKIDIYVTEDENESLILNYKDNEKSILKRYFNTNANVSSNYVNIDVYLTPDEFKQLKNGANVIFDAEKYMVAEITGYDPLGNNKTSLKLIKI